MCYAYQANNIQCTLLLYLINRKMEWNQCCFVFISLWSCVQMCTKEVEKKLFRQNTIINLRQNRISELHDQNGTSFSLMKQTFFYFSSLLLLTKSNRCLNEQKMTDLINRKWSGMDEKRTQAARYIHITLVYVLCILKKWKKKKYSKRGKWWSGKHADDFLFFLFLFSFHTFCFLRCLMVACNWYLSLHFERMNSYTKRFMPFKESQS